MPRFMKDHGFPIKALACSDEVAPRELSKSTMINVAGYHLEPHTDQIKIMTPTVFIGYKKKGKFSKETRFFKEDVSLENLTKFFKGEVISHETILSKTAALYDPLGFAAPIKVFGSFICRKALLESSGDPLKEVNSHLFMQYMFQVKMLDSLVFQRNKYRMKGYLYLLTYQEKPLLCSNASQ